VWCEERERERERERHWGRGSCSIQEALGRGSSRPRGPGQCFHSQGCLQVLCTHLKSPECSGGGDAVGLLLLTQVTLKGGARCFVTFTETQSDFLSSWMFMGWLACWHNSHKVLLPLENLTSHFPFGIGTQHCFFGWVADLNCGLVTRDKMVPKVCTLKHKNPAQWIRSSG
jgi:hypothetical protein